MRSSPIATAWLMLASIILGVAGGLLLFAPDSRADVDARWPDVVHYVDSDDDDTMMLMIVATIQSAVDMFPELAGITFTTAPQDNGEYAVAYGRTIELAERWASDPAGLDVAMRNDVAYGFHPPSGRCQPVQFLILHEVAHVLDNVHGRTGRTALTLAAAGMDAEDLRVARKSLSRYSFGDDGRLNPGEALAEAWAATVCQSATNLEEELAGLI